MFSNIPDEYYPIVSDYAKILLPAFITYLVTRYTLMRPKRYEIRDKQFNLVYLPLYLLTQQYSSQQADIEIYFRKVDKIIYKNYQYVFPKTLKLFTKLKTEWHNGNHNTYHRFNFESQVNSDYEKLKRELGYPSSSFIELFKRLNTLNKVMYLTLTVFLAILIYCLASSVLLLIQGDFINSISAFFVGAMMFFFIYLFSYPMRH